MLQGEFPNAAKDRLGEQIGRRLKLRDLHVFSTVVQRGSMAKAARELGVSHPAVSEVIADLEQALGVRLLDRSAQGIEPRVYGDALLKRSVEVFDALKQSIRDIEFLSDATTGKCGSAVWRRQVYIGNRTIAPGPMAKRLLFGYSGDAQCLRIFVLDFTEQQVSKSRAQSGQRQLRLGVEDLPHDFRCFAPSSLLDGAAGPPIEAVRPHRGGNPCCRAAFDGPDDSRDCRGSWSRDVDVRGHLASILPRPARRAKATSSAFRPNWPRQSDG